MSHVENAKRVFDIEIQGLQTVRNSLDESFNRSVEMILDALRQGGKIVVTGIGKNLHIGEKISATFSSTGATSVLLSPAQALHGDLGILSGKDIALALSYSGESEELLAILPLMKRTGVRIVALTSSPSSSMATHSDAVISIRVEREACPFNMAPTASTTAALAVGDALAMALLEARGFRREEYAKLHPAGAIGRALLLKVSDIMRTGKRLACVPSEATVQDAIIAMTGARAGSAAVVDGDGKVVGILTDGDLRRHLSNGLDLRQTIVAGVMSRSPLSIRSHQLAVDALNIYEKHDIDDLPVVDDDGRLKGMVDIVDLPKFKIM